MCGLAGILHFDRSHPVDRDLLLRMTRSIAHRGPDAEGLQVYGNVGLGHRRLSILDLSSEANQPMTNKDGSVHIVYNGEVYNFRELRAELQSEGCAFRTRSDTEVILCLYEKMGPSFVDRLSGMFALAIWDARRQMLVLARDRIGIKPLYYHVGPSHIVFASELKALLVDPRTPTEIDHAALSDYLHLLSIPDPRSILRDVKKLSPGHLLLVRRGQVEERPYWRIPLPKDPRADLARRGVARIRRAVRGGRSFAPRFRRAGRRVSERRRRLERRRVFHGAGGTRRDVHVFDDVPRPGDASTRGRSRAGWRINTAPITERSISARTRRKPCPSSPGIVTSRSQCHRGWHCIFYPDVPART